MKKNLLTILLLISFLLTGCGELSNSFANHKNIQNKTTIKIYTKNKIGIFLEKKGSIFNSLEPLYIKGYKDIYIFLLKDYHKGTLIIFDGNNIEIKNFSNNMTKKEALKYLADNNLISKVKIFDEIVDMNNKYINKLYNEKKQYLLRIKKKLVPMLTTYLHRKPKMNFKLSNNIKINNEELKSRIKYKYNFNDEYIKYLLENLTNDTLIKDPKPTIHYSGITVIFENRQFLIPFPKIKDLLIEYHFKTKQLEINPRKLNESKFFKLSQINLIKKYIEEYYNNQEKKLTKIFKEEENKVINNFKPMVQYVKVRKVDCIKKMPCYDYINHIKYYINLKYGDKLYMDKINTVYVNAEKYEFKKFVKNYLEKNSNKIWYLEKYFYSFCKQGSTLSCYLLAKNYLKKEDVKNALKFFKKSCDMGYSYGCTNYGSLLFKKRDLVKAKLYWEKGCELNDGMACYKLGLMYLIGDYVIKNVSKGKQLINKACKLGYKEACNRL